MPRLSYKTALRAKGIRPIPKYEVLRSHRSPDEQHIICEVAK
jgi:hypothetical protein